MAQWGDGWIGVIDVLHSAALWQTTLLWLIVATVVGLFLVRLGLTATKSMVYPVGYDPAEDTRTFNQAPASRNLTTRLIFAALYACAGAAGWLWFGPGAQLVSLLFVLSVGMLICVTDWETTFIPDVFGLMLFWPGLLFSPFAEEWWMRGWGACLCFVGLIAVFALIGRLRGEDAQAGGDVILVAAGGAWLGLDGVPVMLMCLSVCFCLYALPYRMKGIVWVPMGPALVFGIALSMFLKPYYWALFI